MLQQNSETLAKRFPPLLVAANQVADSLMFGLHGRRRAGSGEAFWQFRRYQSTDPASLIDWRQSAKSQHVYVREQEWETSQSIWVWCDRSKSMDFCSNSELSTKRDRSHLILVALAALLLRGGERVGLLGLKGNLLRGVGSLPRFVEALTGEFSQLFRGGIPEKRVLPRGSQVVFMGDFLEPSALLEECLKWYSSQGHRGLLAQIQDPAEVLLPYSGRVRFRGMENDEEMVVGNVEGIKSDYEERMLRHSRRLTELANGFGWSFVAHRTDRPPHSALLALYNVLSKEVG